VLSRAAEQGKIEEKSYPSGKMARKYKKGRSARRQYVVQLAWLVCGVAVLGQ